MKFPIFASEKNLYILHGQVFVMFVSDRFGRKVVMVFSHIGLFAVVLGTSFCQSYTAFIVLRILTGAVQQVIVTLCILYTCATS